MHFIIANFDQPVAPPVLADPNGASFNTRSDVFMQLDPGRSVFVSESLFFNTKEADVFNKLRIPKNACEFQICNYIVWNSIFLGPK